MSVYVDRIFIWPLELTKDPRVRRIAARTGGRWCHLTADSQQELLDFAQRMGLNRGWVQHVDTPSVHFDLTPSRRAYAIQLGAIEKGKKK